MPGPTHFSTFGRASYRQKSPPSSPELSSAEPFSLEDMLDSSLIHPEASADSASSSTHHPNGNRNMRNLRRWERVPIGTFRGRSKSQHSSHHPHHQSHHLPHPTSARIVSSGGGAGGASHPPTKSPFRFGSGSSSQMTSRLDMSPVLHPAGDDAASSSTAIPNSRKPKKKKAKKDGELLPVPEGFTL